MKRLFIILLILCPLLTQGGLQAQIFSTASSRHHSYSTGGAAVAPSTYEFQSTSVYGTANSRKSYATAPMQIANGSIKTIASSVTGGVLTNNEGGYIPPTTGNDQGAVIAGVPDLPIGEGWDVALLLALLCVGYVVRRYLTLKQVND